MKDLWDLKDFDDTPCKIYKRRTGVRSKKPPKFDVNMRIVRQPDYTTTALQRNSGENRHAGDSVFISQSVSLN